MADQHIKRIVISCALHNNANLVIDLEGLEANETGTVIVLDSRVQVVGKGYPESLDGIQFEAIGK